MKDKLKEYVEGFMKENGFFAKMRVYSFDEEALCGKYASSDKSINEYIDNNKDENKFQKLLFNYIDRKNLKDSDVYNKVGIDRRLFSKIRSDKDYHPSKDTVILLGISLELSEDEIEDLLLSASYSLPKNNYYDLIIRFCFKERIYDLFTINDYLSEYNCKTLSC